MPDEIQQSSAPPFGSDIAGNCSNPPAHPLSESCKWTWPRRGSSGNVLHVLDGRGTDRHRATFVACQLPAPRTPPPASDGSQHVTSTVSSRSEERRVGKGRMGRGAQ